MMISLQILFACAIGVGLVNGAAKLDTVFEWKRLQFEYLSAKQRTDDIQSGFYDPDVPAPIDVDVFYESASVRTVFVTIPRFANGIPATIGTVTGKRYDGDLMIRPFPSWDWHRDYTSCPRKRIVSVFRTQIDHRCGRLYILDSGYVNGNVVCNPQLLMFNLRDLSNYYIYSFPKEVWNNQTILVTPVLHFERDCSIPIRYVYAADVNGYSLVTTDLYKEYSWYIRHKSMVAEPNFINFDIAGSKFQLPDGILGMTLSPNQRYLHFSPLAGSYMHRISTEHLIKAMYDYNQAYFQTYPTPRRSQSAALAVSKTGAAFFGLMHNLTINCWNVGSDDYGQFIHQIEYDPIAVQFPSGVKMITNRNNAEELWIMTSRFQKVATDGFNFSDVNFRILFANVAELLEYSECSVPNY